VLRNKIHRIREFKRPWGDCKTPQITPLISGASMDSVAFNYQLFSLLRLEISCWFPLIRRASVSLAKNFILSSTKHVSSWKLTNGVLTKIFLVRILETNIITNLLIVAYKKSWTKQTYFLRTNDVYVLVSSLDLWPQKNWKSFTQKS
jgi:hypothetical protein